MYTIFFIFINNQFVTQPLFVVICCDFFQEKYVFRLKAKIYGNHLSNSIKNRYRVYDNCTINVYYTGTIDDFSVVIDIGNWKLHKYYNQQNTDGYFCIKTVSFMIMLTINIDNGMTDIGRNPVLLSSDLSLLFSLLFFILIFFYMIADISHEIITTFSGADLGCLKGEKIGYTISKGMVTTRKNILSPCPPTINSTASLRSKHAEHWYNVFNTRLIPLIPISYNSSHHKMFV